MHKMKLLELDMEKAEAQRRAKMYRIQELEKQFRTFKPSMQSSRTDSCEYYLDHLKRIQSKTKELLNYNYNSLSTDPPKPVLNKENLKSINKPLPPIKIPILVPKSVLDTSKKIQPPTIQKTLKNGDVISVYLVSDPSPAYDPLVKAEVVLDKNNLDLKNPFEAEIHNDQVTRWKSISPKRKKYEDLDLTKPQAVNLRESTPQMKVQRYNYRDYSFDTSNHKPYRHWVGKRMEVYSKIIKNDFKPKVSEKKQIQIQIAKEKQCLPKMQFPGRIKLNDI
jgi:hypothetical protein